MLYIIPTPIWNIQDITLRWLNLLKELEIFLCEDTRTSKKLMNLYNIDYSNKQFFSITSYTSEWKIEFYKKLIEETNVWLLSDAGTPWLSDPWKNIIKIITENNIKFETLPWASAIIPWVVSSWFDTSKFIYLWFLPKKKWRLKYIKYIVNSEIPVFIYESVYRIKKLINQIKEEWFEGKISINREISKIYEQKITDNIDKIIDKLDNWEIKIKGEFVVWFFNTKWKC